MTTIDNNNYDILGKVDSIDLLTHLNKVEQFDDARDDLQKLKTNFNIKDIADKLTELKRVIGNVEEFTDDNDSKIKLLKNLFPNFTTVQSKIPLPPPVTAPVLGGKKGKTLKSKRTKKNASLKKRK